jgi:SAM-dependent methyltransferase
LAATLVAEVGLDSTGRMLDVGCGPGILAVELAGHFEQAIGLDPDAEMLAEGARRATAAGVANIELTQRSPNGLFWDWPGDTEILLSASRVERGQRHVCKRRGVLVWLGQVEYSYIQSFKTFKWAKPTPWFRASG